MLGIVLIGFVLYAVNIINEYHKNGLFYPLVWAVPGFCLALVAAHIRRAAADYKRLQHGDHVCGVGGKILPSLFPWRLSS
jgi:hypothetical protein